MKKLKKLSIATILLFLILLKISYINQNGELTKLETFTEKNRKVIISKNKHEFDLNDSGQLEKNVLFRTHQFMIEGVDQYNPKLVEFVYGLIHKPSKKLINLKNKNQKDFSEIGQSRYIDFFLKKQNNGFFIEAGAYDGEYLSNTLFFELERNWTGLIIEPIPSQYLNILSKNRNIYSINACIAKNRPFVAKFKSSNLLSGRENTMSNEHLKRVGEKSKTLFVPCFSLNTILKALNVSSVDYFSLDIEGGEWDVLTSLDLKNVSFKSFTIDHKDESKRRRQIINLMIQNNYTLTKMDSQDLYFTKNINTS